MKKLQNTNHENEQILVIFDTHHCSHFSLQSITKLASSLKAAVHGVYVEDVNVLNAAGLPFTREITLQSAKARETSTRSMEQELRTFADRMRSLLQQHASTAQVTASFSVVRGPRVATIFKETREARLVVFPAAASKWKSTNEANGHNLRNIIAVYYDGTDSADAALSMAASIASRDDADLVVITNERAHIETVREQLPAPSFNVIIHTLHKAELATLLTDMTPYSPRLFVLPESSQLVQGSDYVRQLVGRLHCDVLLVR